MRDDQEINSFEETYGEDSGRRIENDRHDTDGIPKQALLLSPDPQRPA